jgi:hypothetical protein
VIVVQKDRLMVRLRAEGSRRSSGDGLPPGV